MLDRAALAIAGVHGVRTLLVRALDGGHRINDSDFIHDLRRFREVVTDLDAIGSGVDHGGGAHHVFFLRLRIEGIEMAHAAGHVEVNDVFRLRSTRCGRSRLGDAGTEHRK